jgi:outer membrane lipoprotein SlyB
MKKTIFVLSAITLLSMTGCAAIEHRALEVQVQNQQTIFVSPDALDGRPIFLSVKNQTGKSDLNFENLVAQKLTAKGYKVTKNPKQAGFRILANFLYLDKAKEGMTLNGLAAGGFGGALTGAIIGDTGKAAALGGLAGAGAGALIGALVHVDTWYGVVDVRVDEPLKHAVTRHTRSGSAQAHAAISASGHRSALASDGSANAQLSAEDNFMSYNEEVNHKSNQTRVIAEAKQTNIDVAAAVSQIKEQLADVVANFF